MRHGLGEGPTGLPRSENINTGLLSFEALLHNLILIKILGSRQVSINISGLRNRS
jgi:hypothetical protein